MILASGYGRFMLPWSVRRYPYFHSLTDASGDQRGTAFWALPRSMQNAFVNAGTAFWLREGEGAASEDGGWGLQRGIGVRTSRG